MHSITMMTRPSQMPADGSPDIRSSLDDLNAFVVEAAAKTPGKGIRLRFQPQIYMGPEKGHGFRCWKGVYWNLVCPTVQDVIEFRDALAEFFRALSVFGADEVIEVLRAARAPREAEMVEAMVEANPELALVELDDEA